MALRVGTDPDVSRRKGRLLHRRPELLLSLVAFAAIGLLVIGKFGASYFGNPLVTIDGTYQTFGMLDRLRQFDLPGVRQVPYLGILICYCLAPIYFLLGGTIFAAAAAAQIMVQLSWFLTLAVMCWAAGCSRRLALQIAGTFFLFFLFVFLFSFTTDHLKTVNNLFATAYAPGASLFYLREAAPLGLVLATSHLVDDHRRRQVIAVLAGVFLFWSAAAGVALLVTVTVVQAIGECREPRHWYRNGAVAATNVLLTAISAGLTALVLSGGHPIRLIKRMFIDTASNQFWFFGPFADGARLLTVGDAVRILFPNFAFGLLMLACAAVMVLSWRRAGPYSRRADAIFIVCGSTLVSGFLTQAGGHVDSHYFGGFVYAGVALIVALLTNGALSRLRGWRQKMEPAVWLARRICVIGGPAAVTLVIAVPVFRHTLQSKLLWPFIPRQTSYLSEAGMAFPTTASGEIARLKAERRNMDRMGIPADRRMLSTYHAWPDVLVGARPHPRFNSIIHTLTEADRRDYAQYLRKQKPKIVATINPLVSGWEFWNVRANWLFYREVVTAYQPSWSGTMTTYWRRRSAPVPYSASPLPNCRIQPIGPKSARISFTGPLPAGMRAGLLDVELDYSADLGKLDLSGNLGRGYVRVADRSQALLKKVAQLRAAGALLPDFIDASPGVWYGLPGGTHRQGIPVEYLAQKSAVLDMDLQGGSASRLQVRSCHVLRALPDPFY